MNFKLHWLFSICVGKLLNPYSKIVIQEYIILFVYPLMFESRLLGYFEVSILLPVRSSHKRLLINRWNEKSPDLLYFTLNFTSSFNPSSFWSLSPFQPVALPTSFNTQMATSSHWERNVFKEKNRIWPRIHKHSKRGKKSSSWKVQNWLTYNPSNNICREFHWGGKKKILEQVCQKPS